jgi:GntR family transcriptional regulator
VSSLPEGLQVRVDRHSDLPVGAQLTRALREWIRGSATEGQRLPSVRELAEAAGVNVNTARAVYGRLENEGLLRSEQGRGTFVAPRRRSDAQARAELKRQIAVLEDELARRPPAPSDPFAPAPPQPARLMSTSELKQVRDGLLERLAQLDATREEILRRLAELEREDAEEAAAERAAAMRPPSAAPSERRSTLSVPGARVRWVGA